MHGISRMAERQWSCGRCYFPMLRCFCNWVQFAVCLFEVRSCDLCAIGRVSHAMSQVYEARSYILYLYVFDAGEHDICLDYRSRGNLNRMGCNIYSIRGSVGIVITTKWSALGIWMNIEQYTRYIGIVGALVQSTNDGRSVERTVYSIFGVFFRGSPRFSNVL